tara:strand:+ start:1361 stop:1642 length:282 start_codon:yes stop_codon:yes gene_type:complete
MKDRESFYIKLKSQLDETTKFPSDYLYKFIVSSDGDRVNQVQNLFDNKGAVINTKKSKTGKYTSVSIVINLNSSDEVISYYKEAEKIEGIISL